MNNSIRNLWVLGALLCFAATSLRAQRMAEVYQETAVVPLQEDRQSLLEILNNLERQYEIIFDYDAQLIREKKVKLQTVRQVTSQGNME